MSELHVERAGSLTTVQDRGRVGLAHLGVPRAGPLDRPAAARANRLVGNGPDAALLEVTWGGLEATLSRGAWVSVTGAPVTVLVDGVVHGWERAEWVPAGARLRLGTPSAGVRSYLAVAGGLEVAPVLGSRATDTLAWVGPPRVADGAVMPVGVPSGRPGAVDVHRLPAPGPLRVLPGPQAGWFAAGGLAALCAATYVVDERSDRVGLRLAGPSVERLRDGELPSAGLVLGAVQVPPNGQPVVLMADHPTTGGYPVLAVVHPDDLWQCAQLRPGAVVRFTAAGRTPPTPRPGRSPSAR